MTKPQGKIILVTRFSAFGDVVMSVKLMHALVRQNPECEFVFVTRKPFAFLFENIERLTVYTPDLKNEYKGISGLWRLSRKLNRFKPDAYADIHDVLRTKILRLFLSFSGTGKAKIHKGRSEKKQLTRKTRKKFKPLKNTVERYADVFQRLGLKADFSNDLTRIPITPNPKTANVLSEGKNIGIAPFALHRQKIYPPEKMRQVIELLTQRDYHVYIFGGGKTEQAQADEMIYGIDKAHSLIGRYSMAEELYLMSQTDLMLTMDSANMHLANLAAVKILTVWGATHPYAGFAPYRNSQFHSLQVSHEELGCRPCSVYGNRPCHRGDLACMNRISPQQVADKVFEILQD